jgi:hypothetical protein
MRTIRYMPLAQRNTPKGVRRVMRARIVHIANVTMRLVFLVFTAVVLSMYALATAHMVAG